MADNGTYALLGELATKWGEVQEENNSERHLVAASDFAAWERMDRETVALLSSAIREFDAAGGTVSSTTLQRLVSLNSTINGAKRVLRAELEARIVEEQERRSRSASSFLSRFRH